MKYSSLENFETARIYIYFGFIRTKLSSSLFARWKFDSLAVRVVDEGLEGEVEGSARFSSGKCRSVSFQFAHRRGSRLFWESCFPWPKIYERRSTFQGRRIYARSPRRRLMAGELSVCASIAAHSSSIIRRYITRVHSPWSF